MMVVKFGYDQVISYFKTRACQSGLSCQVNLESLMVCHRRVVPNLLSEEFFFLDREIF